MNRDLFTTKLPQHVEQDRMAANIAHLKTKPAKQQQAHMLCRSLVRMIKTKSN